VAKLPSPCIGVCDFTDKGHCTACSMTRLQKRAFGKADGKKARAAFLGMLSTQQALLGRYRAWAKAYRRKCARKGVSAPV